MRTSVAAALVALALALAGCAGSSAIASFDAAAPCTTDQRVPGAYPALEALVPDRLDDRPPDRLDSGRNCSEANLSTLTSHGIDEVRFAGGLWEAGPSSGMTLAVFSADGLSAPLLGEWFEAGARAARKTEAIEVSHPAIDGRDGFRLDTLNGESRQSVIVWPSADPGVVQVVIAADMSEERIQAGVDAFE